MEQKNNTEFWMTVKIMNMFGQPCWKVYINYVKNVVLINAV